MRLPSAPSLPWALLGLLAVSAVWAAATPTARPVKSVKTDNCSHEATQQKLQGATRRAFLKHCRAGKGP